MYNPNAQQFSQQVEMQHAPQEDIQVISAQYFPVGSYHDPKLHPYQGDLNDMNQISQIIDITRGGTKITANAFTGGNGFLAPSTSNLGDTNIANGWSENRYLFCIRIRITSMGMSYDRFLLGYTSHDGFSLQGTIDPKLLHTVNSVVDLRTIPVRNPQTGHTDLRWTVTESSQMLKPGEQIGYVKSAIVPMRPDDVLYAADNDVLTASHHQITDGRLGFGTGVKFSKRSNNGASTYLASILDSYVKAKTMLPVGHNLSDPNMMAELTVQAQHLNHELPGQTDLLFESFKEIGTNNILRKGEFTYEDLCFVSPGTDSVKHVVPRSSVMGQFSHIDDGCHWMGADNNTIAAVTIAQTLPGILLSNLMPLADVRCTNMVAGLQQSGRRFVVTVIPNGWSTPAGEFAPGVIEDLICRAETAIEIEILANVTKGGQLDIDMNCTCNAYGETIINVSIMGQPFTRYVCATFADSLSAPTMADSVDTLLTLGADINSVVSNVYTSQNERSI